ncbi:nuclear GTPase SLIP-GC-like [Garra rufa]|uniref:nuclear GTPase SLIP-GC-like n=1 Tax=Garra rufa TaxID=137080 RepID=UPI003CCE5717
MDKFHGMTKDVPPLLSVPSPPSTSSDDTKIMLKAKQIMTRVTDNLDHTIIMDKDKISNKHKMNTVNRKKATIGIFGKSGEGKSSLLSAILGKKNLLPSGCFGACTSVVTQVEANLNDSNYTAEIELITKEEWEKELNDLLIVLSDENEDRNEDLIEIAGEKITALYGADADKKTLEELKNDDKYAEIENIHKENPKKIFKSDVSEFATDVARYIQNSEACCGDWYWPIVKSVTIKIPDCLELLEHIVLVDIPGTGDCNKTRDDLWKSKLRECSSVWIVSNINRAITDRDPWGILKHCIEDLGPGGECRSINFICTKTDEINPVAFMRAARLTEDQISDEKKKISTDNDFLKVFTVSSNASFDTSLNLESIETEIPKLQDELRSLNKSINRELTRNYVYEAKGVLSLIQSVQLDTDKKTAEMKDSIRMELESNLVKVLHELDKYFDSIYNDLEQHLSKGVEESVQLCVASTKAFIMPVTYNTLEALCRKGGCHCTKNRDKVLDLNKTLVKHLYEYIDEDFCQIFPVNEKTEKSVQAQIDKFSIMQSDSAYARSSIFHYIHNFIKTEETKLKALFKRHTVDMKKDIYSSIKKTTVNEMASCYERKLEFK